MNPNTSEAIKAGIMGGLMGLIISFLINFFIAPVPVSNRQRGRQWAQWPAQRLSGWVHGDGHVF